MIRHCDIRLSLYQSVFSGAEEWSLQYECVGEHCPYASACDAADDGAECDYRPARIAALTTLLYGIQEELQCLREANL